MYDPTAASFKRIHYALLFGHGLETSTSDSDSSQYRARPAPSQQNLVHGQGVPLRRVCAAGLRMINVNEGHLEHRHMIRKMYINLNCLHQIARSIGRDKGQDQDKMTRDTIRRGKKLLQQLHLQLSKMWFAARESFKKILGHHDTSNRYCTFLQRPNLCVCVCVCMRFPTLTMMIV